MSGSDRNGGRSSPIRYDLIIVALLAAILMIFWILSLAGVRASLANRAFDAGDLAGAYRLAAMATRQEPEMADMWALQARCQEQLGSPCEAALSYAKAVLAATELTAQRSASGTDPTADDHVVALRTSALEEALASASRCESVATMAAVFEALILGLPSSPELQAGLWPGQPELASGRETAESIADTLPEDPLRRTRWIEFLWHRGESSATRLASRSLLAGDTSAAPADLWTIGQALLAGGDDAAATRAFQRALELDSGWLPAAAWLARLRGGLSGDAAAEDWLTRPVPLQTAVVAADVSEVTSEGLLLATNGSVSFVFDRGDGSPRSFMVLEIWGTAANGAFPEVTPTVDGLVRPSFEATPVRSTFTAEVPAGSGPVRITFAFNNDWADASGDRNVFFGPPTVYQRLE